ncbi:ABC transporter substrate-binding protein [Massilia sp. TS11]|uniref:substrate-binding periplasmic protein n=1 Tax=Massilia sp. TS11 TaxID=2908003 RepID=UPI001EDBF394|nr:transporter substrate-binding domain-containing protein [Massilia sp. TS11]MCG2586319.1 transporter substrate-binding domain-containing protein [Massilia sp. TS11]
MRALPAWLLAALLGLAAARAAAGLPAQLVCYDDVFVPYFMPQGAGLGVLSADILSEAGRRLGIAIQFRQMPWRRLESELARGAASTVECAFAFTRMAHRAAYLEYGQVPLQHTEYVLFVRNEAGGVASLADLQGKKIGVRAGFRLPESIVQGVAAGRFQVAEVGADATNFQKLQLRRIDAVLSDATVGAYTLRQLGLTGIRKLSPSLERYDTFVVFSKRPQAAALAAAFDRALAQMQQDGSIERLTAPYLGSQK